MIFDFIDKIVDFIKFIFILLVGAFLFFLFLIAFSLLVLLSYEGYLWVFKYDDYYKREMQYIAKDVKEKCLDTNMKVCEVCLTKGGFSRCDNKTILKSKKEIEDFVKRYLNEKK